MRIDVAWTWMERPAEAFADKTVVVIDVLRATSMVAALLAAGAKEVLPVAQVDEARDLAARLGEKALLAGERGGLPPPGFDLGNSPLAVTSSLVNDRSVVLTTTNGTQAVHRAARSESLVAAAFVNAGAVVEWLQLKAPSEIAIICAGTQGDFSLDDALCAGLLVERLTAFQSGAKEAKNNQAGKAIEVTDAAWAAKALFQRHRGELIQALSTCRHGRVLTSIGQADDIQFAAQIDRYDVVPVRLTGPDGLQLLTLS